MRERACDIYESDRFVILNFVHQDVRHSCSLLDEAQSTSTLRISSQCLMNIIEFVVALNQVSDHAIACFVIEKFIGCAYSHALVELALQCRFTM